MEWKRGGVGQPSWCFNWGKSIPGPTNRYVCGILRRKHLTLKFDLSIAWCRQARKMHCFCVLWFISKKCMYTVSVYSSFILCQIKYISLLSVLLTTTLPLFADAFSIKPRQDNKLAWVGDSAILECIPVSNKSTVWSFIPYGTDRTRVIFDGERVSDDVTTRYSWKPINNGGGSSLKILSVDSSYAGRYTCQSGHDEVITSIELTTVEKRVGFDNATMKFKVTSVGNVKPIVECFETVVNKTHHSNQATFVCKVCLDKESAKSSANDCLGELVVKTNVTSSEQGMLPSFMSNLFSGDWFENCNLFNQELEYLRTISRFWHRGWKGGCRLKESTVNIIYDEDILKCHFKRICNLMIWSYCCRCCWAGGMNTIKSGNKDEEEENFFMRHKALPAFLVVAIVVALVILLAIVAQRIRKLMQWC